MTSRVSFLGPRTSLTSQWQPMNPKSSLPLAKNWCCMTYRHDKTNLWSQLEKFLVIDTFIHYLNINVIRRKSLSLSLSLSLSIYIYIYTYISQLYFFFKLTHFCPFHSIVYPFQTCWYCMLQLIVKYTF